MREKIPILFSYLQFWLVWGLKNYCDYIAGEEEAPALDLAGAKVSYEPPELRLKTLTVLDAAFKIEFVVICHLYRLLYSEAANRCAMATV